MAAMRGPRLQVGSAVWTAEERNAALQIAQSEVDEFSYSARNELDWLNEHMAGIFNENETYAFPLSELRNECLTADNIPEILQKHLKHPQSFAERPQEPREKRIHWRHEW